MNGADHGPTHMDMGGKDTTNTNAEGANPAIWMACLDEQGPTGFFFTSQRQSMVIRNIKPQKTNTSPNNARIKYSNPGNADRWQQFFPADSFYTMGDKYSHASANIVGGRGISSTAHHLFAWSRALQHHRLLTALTQKEMLVPYALRDTVNKISFGYGVLVG